MVIAVIDAVLGAYGRIDGLVNNAGGQYRAPMKTISTKGFEAVVRSNLTGGFIFMREVYNRWMEANGGGVGKIISDIWPWWPAVSSFRGATGGLAATAGTAGGGLGSPGGGGQAGGPGGSGS